MLLNPLPKTPLRQRTRQIYAVHVVPDESRCMQCGICSFTCPVGIDIRAYAWQGRPVDDSSCLTCGLCVASCPRAALQFEPIPMTTTTKGWTL